LTLFDDDDVMGYETEGNQKKLNFFTFVDLMITLLLWLSHLIVFLLGV
jgi:hypothetical protein